ncbi:MAG: SGNH/GDSL hydrolase family protein [Clostridiales bacterium]|jgi:lysophospholipase L1-like esterase|nr:SGNH/GDSL hydrolase family protein [Clostridiales bacterium]
MKNVLLLGDSIRMVYQPLVKEALKGKANVFGPMENGRWSGYTLNSLRFWAPFMPDPDIVHWNCGLWDLGDDYQLGRHFSSPEEYASSLKRTVDVLRKLYGKEIEIIIASTTPVKGGDHLEMQRYNEVIKGVAAESALELNDLFAELIDDIDGCISEDNIHPTPKGAEVLAKKVSAAIERFL